MESKSAKYILGFALLAIWSLLFIRVKERVNQQNEFTFLAHENIGKAQQTANDDFELLLTYADPFKIKVANKKKKHKATSPVKATPKKEKDSRKRKPIKKPVPKKLPEFIYKGYIVVQGGKRVALVNDGARNYNLEVGGKILESTLTRIYEDSIQMKLGEEQMTFFKLKE